MSAIDLPPDLALPLRSGEPWWYWLGGRPALDFANTLRERWRRQVETLVTTADLGRWLVRAGVLDVVPPRIARARLQEARALREAIDAAVSATVAGARVPPAAIASIDAWLAPPQLRLERGVPVLADAPAGDPVAAALAAIALDAARLLGTPAERARLRVCASESCSARFYDRSPAAARRWCSMRECGNVAKARRHRARSRGPAVNPSEPTPGACS